MSNALGSIWHFIVTDLVYVPAAEIGVPPLVVVSIVCGFVALHIATRLWLRMSTGAKRGARR